MTDRLPRRPRWIATAVVAPAAIALLAGAASWTAGHDPAASAAGSGGQASSTAVGAGVEAPEVLQARTMLAADTARLAALEQTVGRLRAQVAAVRSAAGVDGAAPTRAAIGTRPAGPPAGPAAVSAPRVAAPRVAAPRPVAPPRVVSAGS